MEHCEGPDCSGGEICACDCPKCGITHVADDGAVIDDVSQEIVSATAVNQLLGDFALPRACEMDEPGGPICSCGRPSAHESGWCGWCDL